MEEIDHVFETLHDLAPPELKPRTEKFPITYRRVIVGSSLSPHFVAAISNKGPYPEGEERLFVNSLESLPLAASTYLGLRKLAREPDTKAAASAAIIADDFLFQVDRLTIGWAIFLTFGSLKTHPSGVAKVDNLLDLCHKFLALDYDLTPEGGRQRGELIQDALSAIYHTPTKSSSNKQLHHHLLVMRQWEEWRQDHEILAEKYFARLAKAAIGSTIKTALHEDPATTEARRVAALQQRDKAIQTYAELMERGRDGRPLAANGKEIRRENLQQFSYYLRNGYEDPKDEIELGGADQQRAPLVLGIFLAIRDWAKAADSPTGAAGMLTALLQQERALGHQYANASTTLGDIRQEPHQWNTLQEVTAWMHQEWRALEHIILQHDWPTSNLQHRQEFCILVHNTLQTCLDASRDPQEQDAY